MEYVSYKDVTINQLACSHPYVKKIWEYGGCAAIPNNGEMYRIICILLVDGTKKEFIDDGDGKAIEQCNSFLNSL